MGLLTDTIFIKALRSDSVLMAALPSHNVYNNVADPDYDMQNVAVPYIIVNNDGGGNESKTKDSNFESDEDIVNISIRIVAKSRQELAQMSLRVRKTINDYFLAAYIRNSDGEGQDGDELAPVDYTFRFSDIAHNVEKPSHTIVFYYDCITHNEIIENNV